MAFRGENKLLRRVEAKDPKASFPILKRQLSELVANLKNYYEKKLFYKK